MARSGQSIGARARACLQSPGNRSESRAIPKRQSRLAIPVINALQMIGVGIVAGLSNWGHAGHDFL